MSRRGVGESLERLRLARIERTLPADVAAHLTSAAHSTNTLLFLVDAIRREPAVPAGWRAEVAATLRQMAGAFEARGYPVGVAPPAVAEGPAVRGPGASLMRDLAEVLAGFTDAGPAAPPAAARSGFFLPDAFTNPEHLHYALKTTAAAMFCYFLYVLLDWPGIHTCLITCYIVALGTTAETVEKLGLRILGALVGGAVGLAAIVWIVPALVSIWGLLAVVFAGALCGGWVAAGSPRIAYAGFQFVFAFFLCVLQGPGPAFDLTIARDRVIGILVGNAVVYLVFTRVWPVSVSPRIEQALAALMSELGALARLPLAARRWRAPELQAQVAAIREDLALVPYEPAALRPPPEWTRARQTALQAAADLEAPILLDAGGPFWAQLGDRLDRLAARRGGAPPAEGPPPLHPLQTQAHATVLLLETSLAVRA